MPKKDNSTFRHKVALRKRAIIVLGNHRPAVMETHGGEGKIFDACYQHIKQGIVMEKDAERADRLAKQWPTWAVYECDCVAALAGGVGGHVAVELLDVDPYGGCWETIEAFFTSERTFAPRMVVAVNDGLRESLEMAQGWKTKSLQPVIDRHGNDLHPIYLEVCRELMELNVAKAGYKVENFAGYYCGIRGKMTHFLAVLCR